jgi:hypothetical protein
MPKASERTATAVNLDRKRDVEPATDDKAEEIGRRHSDDRRRRAIDADLRADDAGRAVETSLP